MTTTGPVTARVAAGAVTDAAGNDNLASNVGAVAFAHSGTVQFSQPAYAIDEQGSPTLLVTVTRTGGSDGPLDVAYATADGTAVAGTDYTTATGTLHWDDGDATDQTISIPILDDGVLENDSAFTVSLSGISLPGALGTPATTTVTIREQGGIAFTAAEFNTAESGAGSDVTKDVTVSRGFGTHGAAGVHYVVTAGTATEGAGADYTVVAEGDLSWGDLDTADKAIPFTIKDDGLSEGRETINIVLSNPTGNAVLGAQTTAVLAIAHSDGKAGGTPFFEDGPAAPLSDKVTPRLAGNFGTLTYYLTNDAGPISEIVLDGTDAARSIVTLTVAKPLHGTGDGRVQIGEVTQVNGTGVRSLSLGKADLIGAGIDVAGHLGSLTIGDIKNGADITVRGAPPLKPITAGTSITAGRILGTVGQESDITFTNAKGRLSSLSAISVGAGTIAASTAGTITTRGKVATKTTAAILGDFASDLTVTGPSLTTRTPAMGALTLLTGSVPAGVDITAPTIGTIKVSRGNFAGNVTARGTGIDPNPRFIIPALRALYVGGKVTGSTIQLGGAVGTTGNVGSVSVGGFENSRLFAGYTGPDDGTGAFNTGTVGAFTVRAVRGATNQFAQSFVIAANFKAVFLATADTATGPDFGFVFDTSFGTLTLANTPTGRKTYNRTVGGTQQIDGHLFVTKAP
jgi:hypothetical protein